MIYIYVDAPNQLAGAAVDVDAFSGRARPAVGVQLILIAVDCYRKSALAMRCVVDPASWLRCVPTYSTAVRGPRHIVVLKLEVRVKHSRVQLDFAVELVAHLFPVGGWLRHAYRPSMVLRLHAVQVGTEVEAQACTATPQPHHHCRVPA